ncbi:hypothetical protein B0J11DRAFT_334966 [Dendryphion nanum]|uniref:Vomeronasal type-1 receptor n=1 Tax=Dendryphion nanum TaxID=256645 RepID=A0A9P9DMV6_9PLEO|nr:hypothetical protein B0J11DRAFT_334966 [Dendryphion nanum]
MICFALLLTAQSVSVLELHREKSCPARQRGWWTVCIFFGAAMTSIVLSKPGRSLYLSIGFFIFSFFFFSSLLLSSVVVLLPAVHIRCICYYRAQMPTCRTPPGHAPSHVPAILTAGTVGKPQASRPIMLLAPIFDFPIAHQHHHRPRIITTLTHSRLSISLLHPYICPWAMAMAMKSPQCHGATQTAALTPLICICQDTPHSFSMPFPIHTHTPRPCSNDPLTTPPFLNSSLSFLSLFFSLLGGWFLGGMLLLSSYIPPPLVWLLVRPPPPPPPRSPPRRRSDAQRLA